MTVSSSIYTFKWLVINESVLHKDIDQVVLYELGSYVRPICIHVEQALHFLF